MERPPHKESGNEAPHEDTPNEKWHWWYGYEEHLHNKKNPAKETKLDPRSGSSEAPRTEGTAGEPREEGRTETEPQAWERIPGGYSAEEKIKGVVKDKDTQESLAILSALLKQAPGQGDWLSLYPEGGDAIKKSAHEALLKEIKYYCQRSDYNRVKAITDKGKPTPWPTNTNWNKVGKTMTKPRTRETFGNRPGEYEAAWRRLRTWANEKKIWIPDDEREFSKETDKKDWAIWETTRNLGLNVAVGGLYGLGYAMTVGPWKLFGLGLEYASKLTDNEKYTKGMMEKMFKKKREKAKGEPKKEEWNKAKEYEVRQKVKKIEMQYIRDLKGQIVEQKAQDGKKPEEEYATLTDDRKEELRKGAGEKGYENVWRTLRVHWIQEGAWKIDDEKEFRKLISDNKNEFKLRDFLTQEECSTLKKLQKEQTNLKKEVGGDKKHEKYRTLIDTEEKIADLKNREETRKNEMRWPEYKTGKKKGGSSAENFVTEDETDEDEEYTSPQNSDSMVR